MNEFVRARQPEQKEERRGNLLATARAMLEGGTPLRDLSLNELARQAGMAKSNVYRYFETREALLLALLWDEWAAWYADMTAEYTRPGRGHRALDALVRHVARTLAARPLLGQLTAVLPSVVEQNLSEDTLRSFKEQSLLFFREIARFLASCAPELTEDDYADLVHDTVAVLVGLYAFAHPAPAAAKVLEAPELAFFRRDYEGDLTRVLLALAWARAKGR